MWQQSGLAAMGRNSLHPKGLNHLPVLPPTLHPQDLSPTCPTGVSGSPPPGPSAQLIYGKEGCKQRTRGRRRTKAASLLFAPPRVQSLFTSRCRGASAQAKNPSPFALQGSSTSCHLLAGAPLANLGAPSQPWSTSYNLSQHLVCSVQGQGSPRDCISLARVC